MILEGSTGAVGAVSPTDLYFDRASAGNATVIANGATTPGSPGSFIEFDRTATADNATLIVNGGTNGGNGGTMFVYAKSTGGTAQLRLFGNGTLDLTYHDPGTFSIGSLAGDGMVLLATNTLRVGTNNLTTEFDGDLVDSAQPPGGSLTKTGSGNLTLTGANAYQGDTIIEGRGILFVNNASGSGTGTGSVQVNSGELAGNGTISGPVVVGNGNPGAARLRPGKSEHNPAVLTIDNTLTFSSDGTFLWLLDAVGAIASSAVANGVTIDSAALFTPLELQSGTLTTGTVFTVITNNGLGAIAGRFSNLADGGTITIGSNTFQANYEGGDGNDLTLKVVQ